MPQKHICKTKMLLIAAVSTLNQFLTHLLVC